MNLFQLQEQLKNFSQDQLVREMRNPSGSAPQYLILSELQRRRRIMNEEQAQMPQQASVAEEAVAAAGMPQGGLAQMAQAMAPETDVVQNTARMADGGEVRRMDVGGLADITPNLKAYGVDAFLADPRVREAALRSEMTPYEYLQMLNEDQLNYLRDTPIEDSYARLRDEASFDAAEFDAGRYDGPGGAYLVTERSGVPGRARLSEAGLTGVEPVPTVSAEDISRMANADRIDESADAFSVIGAGVAGPYTEFLERMAETPLFPERRGMQFGETPIGAIQSERTEEPMEETLRRILENSEAAIARDEGRVATPASTYDEVMPFDRNVYGSDDPYALPADTGMRTDVSGPGYQTRDVFIPADEFEQGLGTTDFGGNDPESLPAEIILEQERERLAEQFQTEAEAADAETAALDRAALAEQFEAEGEVADAEARLPVVDLTEQREGAGGGGAAGAGEAGGAGGGMSSDDLYEQDKWLALAQFGLGLMSSRAPTLGQAIGEAGATGIAALRQAREDRQDRIEAAQTRADRLAAAAARASSDEAEYPYRQIDDIIGLADAYQNQANAIVESLGAAPTENDPEYEDYINSLARANTYRDYARQAIGIQ